MVTISISIWGRKSTKKFDKNVRRSDPAEFYHVEKKQKGQKKKVKVALKVAQSIPPLPNKVLRINITIPAESRLPEMHVGGSAEHYLVHVNEQDLKQNGYNFSEMIANWSVDKKKKSKKAAQKQK